MKITTIFLDFDGVVADTEPLYGIFWGQMADKYHLGTDFPALIKGMTMTAIFDRYFPNVPEEERQEIVRDCQSYEGTMDYREVAGAIDFIRLLKQKNYKVGLVTSSPGSKMGRALGQLCLEDVFDTVVTADRIQQGKPHPMCYLMAATDLRVKPQECVVFEDSFSGIEAGNRAGMKVIGLATTNSAEAISGKVHAVIPDFSDAGKVLDYFVN